ncbi:MAG: hypothetical protein LBC40_08920, partial [Dysgonamonadaceae bacterium]|nr:hypothetical protein [Dysgonamonadaceae bacterium]
MIKVKHAKQMPKTVKNIVFYVVMLVVFGTLMYLLVKMGGRLETAVHTQVNTSGNNIGFLSEGFKMFTESLTY